MAEALALLEARDCRHRYQNALLEANGYPLVVFSMNIPGADKCSAAIEALHDYGVAAFLKRLEKSGTAVNNCHRCVDIAGVVTFVSVDANPEAIKHQAVDLEASDEWGRMFDIDVIRPNGQPVSRQDIHLPPRQCFLCGEPANVCRRAGTHEPEEVMAYVQARIKAFTQTYINKEI